MIFMIKKDVVFFGTPVCTGAGCRFFMKDMITFGVYDKIGSDFNYQEIKLSNLHICTLTNFHISRITFDEKFDKTESDFNY